MKLTRHTVFALLAFGAVACGAFLADSGDDSRPSPSPAPDASSADDSASDAGGTSADGSSQPDANADTAFVRRATCGAKICAPGVPCCVSSAGESCVIGDMTCTGSELLCTRNPDCAPGETCCITVDPTSLGLSSSTCVKGTCPAGADVICSTQDDVLEQGCGPLTCTPGGKTTSYGLPAGDPWAICQ